MGVKPLGPYTKSMGVEVTGPYETHVVDSILTMSTEAIPKLFNLVAGNYVGCKRKLIQQKNLYEVYTEKLHYN